MAHLRAMPRCLAAIRACFPPLAEADLKQFAEEDAEHTRVMKMQSWFGTKALCPAMRAAGPALPPPGSPDAAAMLARWTTRRPPDAVPLFQEFRGRCTLVAPDEACALLSLALKTLFLLFSGPLVFLGGMRVNSRWRGLARLHSILHIRTLCLRAFLQRLPATWRPTRLH